MGDGGIMEREESFKSAKERAGPVIPSASNGSWNWLSLIWIILMASLFLIVISGRNVLINKTRDKVQPCLVPLTIWNQACLRPGQLWTGSNNQERRQKMIFVNFWGGRLRSKFPPPQGQAMPHTHQEALSCRFLMVAVSLKHLIRKCPSEHLFPGLLISSSPGARHHHSGPLESSPLGLLKTVLMVGKFWGGDKAGK